MLKQIISISEYAFERKSAPLVVFVNGFTGGIGKWFGKGCEPLRSYWSEGYIWDQLPDNSWTGKYEPNQFIHSACSYFAYKAEECNWCFMDGSDGFFGLSNARMRYRKGKKQSISDKEWAVFQEAKEVFFVTHSMGGSFAEGIIQQFSSRNISVKKVVHFATAGARNMICSTECLPIDRIQLNTSGDKTIDGLSDPWSRDLKRKVPFVNLYGRVLWDPHHNYPKKMQSVRNGESKMNINSHYDTKTFGKVFSWVKHLEKIQEEVENDSKNQLERFQLNVHFESFYANKMYYKWDHEIYKYTKMVD